MLTPIVRMFTSILLLVMLASYIGANSTTTQITAYAAEQNTGIILSAYTVDGTPIANADVLVAPLKLRGQTNEKGEVTFDQLQITDQLNVTVTVTAQGYRSWIIQDAIVYPNDTLILDAPLSIAQPDQTTPEIITVPVHRTESAEPQTMIEHLEMVTPLAAGSNTTPPTSIRVYRTQLGRVDTVEFRQYVKHVLPNEWVASWPTESLRSGAMASKTYAWYRTMYPKYPRSGYDTRDTTADQVYNPNVSYASTNAAVDDTWNYRFTRNGAIFETQYCAGTYNNSRTSGQCGENHGFVDGNFMSQNGSHYWADQGKDWQWILNFYYSNIAISTIGSTPPPSAEWPLLRNGDQGSNVITLQHLLNAHGYTLSADGVFGSGTENAVRSFQTQQQLTADGVVGSQTWSQLVITVRSGDNGSAVRAAQQQLNKYGYNLAVDGVFGGGTDSAVRSFQSSHGLTADGIIGPNTWQALLSGG